MKWSVHKETRCLARSLAQPPLTCPHLCATKTSQRRNVTIVACVWGSIKCVCSNDDPIESLAGDVLTQPVWALNLKGGFPPCALINEETDRKCITYQSSSAACHRYMETAVYVLHPHGLLCGVINTAVWHRDVFCDNPQLSLRMWEGRDKNGGLIHLWRGFLQAPILITTVSHSLLSTGKTIRQITALMLISL